MCDDEDDFDPDGWAEDEFDYEQYVAENHGGSKRATGVSMIWQITALVLLLAFGFAVVLPLLR